MKIYFIAAGVAALAAIAAVVLAAVFRKQRQREEAMAQELAQLRQQAASAAQSDAALTARQEMLIQTMERSLAALQSRQTEQSMQLSLIHI